MNLLNTLTQAVDEEQLRLHPLPEHAAVDQPEHFRQHYALLLASVLTTQPAVSEPQTRLLRLLLDSLKLGDIRAQLFEQARALEADTLLEAARLIREAGFAHHLLVDVLVLLRLDVPLTEETSRLVGELAAFLGLNETELATRATDAGEILGLHVKENDHAEEAGKKSPKAKEIVTGKADKKSETETGNPGEAPARQTFSLAEFWPKYLRQPLTVEALRAGLQGGVWMLDADMAAHFPWQADDAILFFHNSAVLSTIPDAGEVKLTNCRLVDAALSFTGKCSISLEGCDWQGDYDPGLNKTALMTNGQALTVTDCQFSTRNARAISVDNASMNLTGSRFTHCGHPELDGGAVWHSDNDRTIENCYFDRCLAACGGALYFNRLYGLNKSEFVSCESRRLQDENAGDIAVYAQENLTNPVLMDCVFRHSSINVGDSCSGIYRRIAVGCQFISGNLYYYRNGNHKSADNCTFMKGGVHEKLFRAKQSENYAKKQIPSWFRDALIYPPPLRMFARIHPLMVDG